MKSFITIDEHLEVPILCTKIYKKVLLYIFFTGIQLVKLCTFRMYTPQSNVSTHKFIACLGVQPPCLWAGIITNKIIIYKYITSNILGFINVVCDTAHYGGLVIVCVPCIWYIVWFHRQQVFPIR